MLPVAKAKEMIMVPTSTLQSAKYLRDLMGSLTISHISLLTVPNTYVLSRLSGNVINMAKNSAELANVTLPGEF